VAAIYENVRSAGKSSSHLRHLRSVLRNRLAVAFEEETIQANPVDRARLHKGKIDRLERTVLTDDELVRYLGWQHPQVHHRRAVLERQTMSVLARIFGGLRTGDLHALKWSGFDTTNDAFTNGKALRQKTKRPQTIEVPEMLRPILRDWWERQGKPASGLVFPCLRGKRAGEGTKIGVSHADALRRDLARAFGIEVLNTTSGKWEVARDMSDRERELLEETEFTRPVDFHSWRRAFVQALADMGMSAQQAQKLAGHADLSAHERYLRNSTKTLTIPEAALPRLGVSWQPSTIQSEPVSQPGSFSARHARFEPATFGSGGQRSIQLS